MKPIIVFALKIKKNHYSDETKQKKQGNVTHVYKTHKETSLVSDCLMDELMHNTKETSLK